jgi:hypothetical protein
MLIVLSQLLLALLVLVQYARTVSLNRSIVVPELSKVILIKGPEGEQ